MAYNSIDELEQNIEGLQAQIDRRDQVLKLQNSPLFRKVILDAFCTVECAKYAQESADVSLSLEGRQDALGYAQAAGFLRRWMSMVVTQGNQAEKDIES